MTGTAIPICIHLICIKQPDVMMSSKEMKIEEDTSVFFMQMSAHLVMTLWVKTVCDVTPSRDTHQPFAALPSLYSVQYGFNVVIFGCSFRSIFLVFIVINSIVGLKWVFRIMLLYKIIGKLNYFCWLFSRKKESCVGFAQPNLNFRTVFLTPFSLWIVILMTK